MFRKSTLFSLLVVTGLLFTSSAVSAQLKPAEVDGLLKTLDQKQRALGDYKATLYIEQRVKGESDLVFQAITYRRESEEKFVFLFTKPKTSAGKGYLLIDRNLFLYDPSVGRWSRTTERERLGGTDSRRQDFDTKDLAKNYDAKFVGTDKLGEFEVNHLQLTAKKDALVPFPKVELWVDKKTNNILKQQDFSLSGKLLRSLYFLKWDKVARKSGEDSMYFPREIRVYDELNKGNQTIIVLQEVELGDLPKNLFTKAWLQQRSR